MLCGVLVRRSARSGHAQICALPAPPVRAGTHREDRFASLFKYASAVDVAYLSLCKSAAHGATMTRMKELATAGNLDAKVCIPCISASAARSCHGAATQHPCPLSLRAGGRRSV